MIVNQRLTEVWCGVETIAPNSKECRRYRSETKWNSGYKYLISPT